MLIEPQAQEKSIHLQKAVPNTDVQVQGDPSQLYRIFSNLVHNAIQYTPTGGTVRVALTQQAKTATVTVEDSGVGIADAHLPHLFERFWRANKARDRRQGGTGLGLAIVGALVQQHEGKITVKSRVGEGSCFRVVLPMG